MLERSWRRVRNARCGNRGGQSTQALPGWSVKGGTRKLACHVDRRRVVAFPIDLRGASPYPVQPSKWALERVQTPSRGFLGVPDRWKERDLEEFLWANWESIDFGFDRPIYLVGKQERLSDSTNDRVDLLAKGRSGEMIAIELKIVEARRGDYTQLTSYMGNLESSRVPADKVRGILVAPAFSQKVLNSAAIEPRITLLRFNRVP